MPAQYSARNNAPPADQHAAVAVLLPLASIDSSPLNPRSHSDDADLQRLADSLQADGLLQPIVVTPAGDRYRIMAGERRWRAAGASERVIMSQTGHRSAEMVRKYIREGSLFREKAARLAGL